MTRKERRLAHINNKPICSNNEMKEIKERYISYKERLKSNDHIDKIKEFFSFNFWLHEIGGQRCHFGFIKD